MEEIFAQSIGIVATILNVSSYQMKSNRGMFLLKGVSGALFAIHFFMLGNLTASLLNLFNLFRGIVLVGGEKWHKTPWLIAIEACYVLSFVLTFGRSEVAIGGAVVAMIISIVVTLEQLYETIELWRGSGKRIRIFQMCFFSPVWLVNNLLTGSVGGVITETIAIASAAISLVRYRKSGFIERG